MTKKSDVPKPRNPDFIRKSSQVIEDKREKEQDKRHRKRELDIKKWREDYRKIYE